MLGGKAFTALEGHLAPGAGENQYITFRIGEEEYGIDIMLVQEIIRYHRPTRVFNAASVIKGVINFRGRVIPVIDMHRKFNLPEQEYDDFTVVIVIEVGKKILGMVVDRVSDIMSFKEADLQLVDGEFADDIKADYLKGMGKTDSRIVLLLDQHKVLSSEERHQLEKAAAEWSAEQLN